MYASLKLTKAWPVSVYIVPNCRQILSYFHGFMDLSWTEKIKLVILIPSSQTSNFVYMTNGN